MLIRHYRTTTCLIFIVKIWTVPCSAGRSTTCHSRPARNNSLCKSSPSRMSFCLPLRDRKLTVPENFCTHCCLPFLQPTIIIIKWRSYNTEFPNCVVIKKLARGPKEICPRSHKWIRAQSVRTSNQDNGPDTYPGAAGPDVVRFPCLPSPITPDHFSYLLLFPHLSYH